MDAGVRMIHVDVMDGHFVPNITIGPAVVEALAPLVHERGGLLSVHLMIEHPEDYLEAFVAAGRRRGERARGGVPAPLSHHRDHQAISGRAAGVAINPGTDVWTGVRGHAALVDYAAGHDRQSRVRRAADHRLGHGQGAASEAD